jgi:hypothetical protein
VNQSDQPPPRTVPEPPGLPLPVVVWVSAAPSIASGAAAYWAGNRMSRNRVFGH